jgi:DNA polymerase delta subunit 3
MQDMSEDEDDNNNEPAFEVDEEKNDLARRFRQDRQEKLRKMMEDDGKLHFHMYLI